MKGFPLLSTSHQCAYQPSPLLFGLEIIGRADMPAMYKFNVVNLGPNTFGYSQTFFLSRPFHHRATFHQYVADAV